MGKLLTGHAVRCAARENRHTTSTSGLAPNFLQANMIILPSCYASDFRLLCARNTVPCPLIAESNAVGQWDSVRSWIQGLEGSKILSDCDLRRDAPRYMVYKDGKLIKHECQDVVEEWTEDHVAFLIGCSYSFETALIVNDLCPRHTMMNRNVPMYRTNVRLCPAGVFTGSTYVVSMRPYKAKDVEEVRNITRKYSTTHGEPIAWGWDALEHLGIANIDSPDWGDAPLTLEGCPFGETKESCDEIPVFWGCGVTPQEAVMRAKLDGTVMAHAPGHMLLLDCQDSDLVQEDASF